MNQLLLTLTIVSGFRQLLACIIPEWLWVKTLYPWCTIMNHNISAMTVIIPYYSGWWFQPIFSHCVRTPVWSRAYHKLNSRYKPAGRPGQVAAKNRKRKSSAAGRSPLLKASLEPYLQKCIQNGTLCRKGRGLVEPRSAAYLQSPQRP